MSTDKSSLQDINIEAVRFTEADQRAIAESDPRRVAILRSYPPALSKACDDPFDYIMHLKCGVTIRFREATPVSTGWVRINVIEDDGTSVRLPIDCNFNRGIDVRVSQIAWVADVGDGE